MNAELRTQLDAIYTTDRPLQSKAFFELIEATEQPVDWAYEAWDELLAALHHQDNHVRAIAAQVLCNLAKSDPEDRMLRDLDALINVTRDERFVTARHTMQSLWKVGVAGKPQREKLVEGLAGRFAECSSEKNCTLIRYDILQCLRNVYDAVGDEKIRQKALALIESETDFKYRKKYMSLWKS